MTRKALVVAQSEFMTNVRSRAFIIGVVLMPVMVGGLVAMQFLLMTSADTDPRRFAVIDHTGVLYEPLAKAADVRNAELAAQSRPSGAPFIPSLGQGDLEQAKLQFSDRIEKKDLFGFLEIPADVLDAARSDETRIRYHTNRPTYDALPRWIETTLNREILVRRLQMASIDPDVVRALNRPVRTEHMGLLKRDAQGAVKDATAVNRGKAFGTPAALMMAIFLLVMISAAPPSASPRSSSSRCSRRRSLSPLSCS